MTMMISSSYQSDQENLSGPVSHSRGRKDIYFEKKIVHNWMVPQKTGNHILHGSKYLHVYWLLKSPKKHKLKQYTWNISAPTEN